MPTAAIVTNCILVPPLHIDSRPMIIVTAGSLLPAAAAFPAYPPHGTPTISGFDCNRMHERIACDDPNIIQLLVVSRDPQSQEIVMIPPSPPLRDVPVVEQLV